MLATNWLAARPSRPWGLAAGLVGSLLGITPAGAQTPPPLPAGSGAPATSPAPPGSAPPPYMYQEQWTPPPGDLPPSDGPPSPGARRPPPPLPPYPPPTPAAYSYEPPPPAPLLHRSPFNALWVGARLGALFPFGNAYALGVDPYYGEYGDSWAGLASGGLVVEADVGVRFARHYIVYGYWEHARMGTGNDSTWRTGPHLVPAGFGDQDSANTDFPGIGFRWSARPDATGLVVDLGLGYRWFRETWSSGAQVEMQGFGEFRLGFGVDTRINRLFSLSPLIMFSSGSFSDRQITLPGLQAQAIPSYAGTHGTVTLSVGGHFDFGR